MRTRFSLHGVVWHTLHRILRFIFKLFYRVHLKGAEHLPQNKAALLVSNHVSFIDGFVLSLMMDRPVRFLVFKSYYYFPLFYPIMRFCRAIPIASGRKHRESAIQAARDALNQGDWICIFAEGMITRTGHIQSFRPGFEKIADGLNVPIVPIHLEGLWRSAWAFRDGKLFASRFGFQRIEVIVSVGHTLKAHTKAMALRKAIESMGAEAKMWDAKLRNWRPDEAIQKITRRNVLRPACTDSNTTWTYWQLWHHTWQRIHWLNTHLPEATYPNVGLVLPPSKEAVAWIWAFTLLNRHLTLCHPSVDQTLKDVVHITHLNAVIGQSHHIQAQGWHTHDVHFFDTSDIHSHLKSTKRHALWKLLCPKTKGTTDLQRTHVSLYHPASQIQSHQGVHLSCLNLYASLVGLDQILQWTRIRRVMGSLPLADAWGYTITLWLPLLQGLHVIYNPQSEDMQHTKQLLEQHTPQAILDHGKAYQGYIQALLPKHLGHVVSALVPDHSLPEHLLDAFRDYFGFELWSGFGTNETSGPMALNRSHFRLHEQLQRGNRPGSVGITLPGVMVRIMDPDTQTPCPQNAWGQVQIKGPRVATAPETLHMDADGWCHLNLWGHLDKEGFLFLKGDHTPTLPPHIEP